MRREDSNDTLTQSSVSKTGHKRLEGYYPSRRSNWRQQRVRDQLGHASSSDESRSSTPPIVVPIAVPLRMASLKLEFVVVGGSLGGLAVAFSLARAGHSVHVIEQRPGVVKEAFGIRIPPNLARVLDRWGLDYKDKAILCKQLTFRKLQSTEPFGKLEYKEEVMKVLEADFWLMHFADLLEQMYDLAISAGAVVQFNTRVTSVDASKPSVTLSTGEVLTPDIVIGADGYQSICQQIIEEAVIDEGDEPSMRKDSGVAVYSMNADVSDVTSESDPEAYELMHQPVWMAFAGPGVSILSSPSRDYTNFSMQLFAPDPPGSEPTWDKEVTLEKLAQHEPRIHPALWRMMQRARKITETKFVIRRTEDWVHPSCKLVLLGESAHPQIPSSSHSGSLPVEDAAVFGALFSRLRSRDQIQTFLHAFQELRFERCWDIQKSESDNSDTVMLPDGPAQEERDRTMSKAAEVGSGGWDDSTFRHLWENIRILFAYDPEEDVEEWWQRWGQLRERAESDLQRGRIIVSTQGDVDYETTVSEPCELEEEDQNGNGASNRFSMGMTRTVTVESASLADLSLQ